jgi:hypothetical protein
MMKITVTSLHSKKSDAAGFHSGKTLDDDEDVAEALGTAVTVGTDVSAFLTYFFS